MRRGGHFLSPEATPTGLDGVLFVLVFLAAVVVGVLLKGHVFRRS